MLSRPLSRRLFLGAAGSATCLAAMQMPRVGMAAEKSVLNLGLQMYSLRGYKVGQALMHARELGFKFIEFFGKYVSEKIAERYVCVRKFGRQVTVA